MPARRPADLDWRLVPIDRGDSGVRIDRALMRHLRGESRLSRTRIQKAIDAGDVLVNGTPAPRAAWRLADGDEVRVRLERPAERVRPGAEAMPLAVIYEDADLLAVSKPAGVVVHPSYKNASGTLLNGILRHAESWPTGSTPCLLGRLDKQTSGIVVVAKRPEVHARLQRAMDARLVDKDYLAVVWGKVSPPRGTIDLALDRDPWDRRRITVTDRGGQPAVTLYQRLAVSARRGEAAPVFSLVRCRLVTGRTHQIRVHLAAREWPIVGDQSYGRRETRDEVEQGAIAAARFPRQALHAWRIELPHPADGRRLTLVAPLSNDLRELCDVLGLVVPAPAPHANGAGDADAPGRRRRR